MSKKKKTFHDLDEYVKLEIFEYLDYNSLLNCFEVSKEWNRLLSSHAASMKKVSFCVPKNWSKFGKQFEKNERHYHTMVFNEFGLIKEKEVSSMLKVIKPLTGHVQVLRFNASTLPIEKWFFRTLDSFKSLRKLFFEQTKDKIEMKSVTAPKLTLTLKLKSLAFISIHDDIIEILNKWGVQSSKILYRNNVSDKNFTPITEFLKKQQHTLHSLGIELFDREQQKDFFEKIIKNSNLTSIKSLSLLLRGQTASKYPSLSVDLQNMGEFIKRQKSLHELEIKARSISLELLQTIQHHMHLDKLVLSIKDITAKPPFDPEIPQNIYMKSLIIQKPIKPETLFDLFRMFPSIEHLSIEGEGDEIAEHLVTISNQLEKVKVLKISIINEDAPEIQIPSLQTLHVDNVESIEALQKFLSSNRSIKHLVVKFLYSAEPTDPKKVADLTKGLVELQSFVIDERFFKPTNSMLDSVHANSPKLKTIQVCNHNHETEVQPDVLEDVYCHSSIRVNRYVNKYYVGMQKHQTIWNNDKDWNIDGDMLEVENDEVEEDEEENEDASADSDSSEDSDEMELNVGNFGNMLGFFLMQMQMPANFEESQSDSDDGDLD